MKKGLFTLILWIILVAFVILYLLVLNNEEYNLLQDFDIQEQWKDDTQIRDIQEQWKDDTQVRDIQEENGKQLGESNPSVWTEFRKNTNKSQNSSNSPRLKD